MRNSAYLISSAWRVLHAIILMESLSVNHWCLSKYWVLCLGLLYHSTFRNWLRYWSRPTLMYSWYAWVVSCTWSSLSQSWWDTQNRQSVLSVITGFPHGAARRIYWCKVWSCVQISRTEYTSSEGIMSLWLQATWTIWLCLKLSHLSLQQNISSCKISHATSSELCVMYILLTETVRCSLQHPNLLEA